MTPPDIRHEACKLSGRCVATPACQPGRCTRAAQPVPVVIQTYPAKLAEKAAS
jgi:hypothetical protein